MARLAWSEPIRPAVVAGLEHRFHLRFPQAYCQLLLTRGVPRLALKATRHDDAGTQALIPPSDLPRARRMALSWFETRSDFDASFGHLVPFQFTKGRGDPDVFVFDPRRPTRAGEPSVRLLRHDDASASPSRPSFTTHCRGWVNALLAQFD